MSTNTTINSINDLIASKKPAEGVAPGTKDEIRFIVTMTSAQREQLRSLCETLSVKQIQFASELFNMALAQAVAAAKAQSKAAPVVPPVPAK